MALAALEAHVARALVRTLGAPLRVRDPLQPADAIVILGAQVRADGTPSAALDERIRAGVSLYQRGLAPCVYVTGGPCAGFVEADIMAQRARQLGVPEHALRIERRARNTAENACYVARILASEARGRVCRVWIVSQPFHLRRAVWLFGKYGLQALAWYPDNSLEFTRPHSGLRWIVREYGSIARCCAIEAASVARDALPRVDSPWSR